MEQECMLNSNNEFLWKPVEYFNKSKELQNQKQDDRMNGRKVQDRYKTLNQVFNKNVGK